MTPAGRPPRSNSSSKKSVSIRLTIEEHELLNKAAYPMYLSDWLRKIALGSHDVRALMPPSDDEPVDLANVRAMFAMQDLKIRTVRESIADPEKRALVDDLHASIRTLLGSVLNYVDSIQPQR